MISPGAAQQADALRLGSSSREVSAETGVSTSRHVIYTFHLHSLHNTFSFYVRHLPFSLHLYCASVHKIHFICAKINKLFPLVQRDGSFHIHKLH